MRILAVLGVCLLVACPGNVAPRGAPDAFSPAAADAPPADAPLTDAPLTDGPLTDAPHLDAPPPPDARRFDARPPAADAPPGPAVGGCPMFPPGDPWNQDVSQASVDTAWTATIHASSTKPFLHPDFGSGFGIPFNVVPQSQAGVPITFDIADESDPGPYPFPPAVAIEGGTPTSCGGDCHVLVVQQGVCLLWEAWACLYDSVGASWSCGSGAKFDLSKIGPGQRPLGWTSADAAGLAITPGLVRVDEVNAGVVRHAIRFTFHCTQDGWVYPASHEAVPCGCPTDLAVLRANYPPMGTRVRLKSTYSTASLTGQARPIAEAMKTYGMILADNGSDWFFQGEDNPGWSNGELDALKTIPSDQFEVLAMPPIQR